MDSEHVKKQLLSVAEDYKDKCDEVKRMEKLLFDIVNHKDLRQLILDDEELYLRIDYELGLTA